MLSNREMQCVYKLAGCDDVAQDLLAGRLLLTGHWLKEQSKDTQSTIIVGAPVINIANLHCVSKNVPRFTFAITSSDVGRFL